jgi:pimeloyl-ACP methyl ester carboxylesterase
VNEKFIQINNHKIRYLESGNSTKTLVLIHGLGASAERWEKVVPFFEKDFHIVIPDLIGFGYSDKPLTDYTIDYFSKFLQKFLDSINIKNPILVGSSLGGQISVEYTAEHSTNVEKLILVSPSGVMKQSTPALDAYIMAALYPNEQNAKNAFELMEGSGKSTPQEIIDGFVKRMKLPNAKLAFMSTILGLKNAKTISEKLHSITVPTMIVWGSDDPVIPIQHASEFVESIQNCKFFKMDGIGHTPYVQDPSSFASKIIEFLNDS